MGAILFIVVVGIVIYLICRSDLVSSIFAILFTIGCFVLALIFKDPTKSEKTILIILIILTVIFTFGSVNFDSIETDYKSDSWWEVIGNRIYKRGGEEGTYETSGIIISLVLGGVIALLSFVLAYWIIYVVMAISFLINVFRLYLVITNF